MVKYLKVFSTHLFLLSFLTSYSYPNFLPHSYFPLLLFSLSIIPPYLLLLLVLCLSPLFISASFSPLPPLFLPPSSPVSGHFSCVSSAGCHTWAVRLSLLKIYEPWISYFQLIYFVVCFHFFLLMWVIWQFGVVFKSPPHKHSCITALLFPLTGCHRLWRREEICFRHMLIYSELLVEADRYLFPRGRRESDGDCCYVFIYSTPPDELSHPRMEKFRKHKVFGSAATWIMIEKGRGFWVKLAVI